MKLTKGKILKYLHKKRQSRKKQTGSITSHETKTMKRNIYVNLMRQTIKRRSENNNPRNDIQRNDIQRYDIQRYETKEHKPVEE